MWNVHGKQGYSIRISVDADRFSRHLQAQGYRVAYGRVTYEGMTSSIRPQFLSHWGLTEAEDSVHHFFFHKRGCFEWEQEFRVILASNEAARVPLVDDMITSIVISHLATLDPTTEGLLRDRFGDRVRKMKVVT